MEELKKILSYLDVKEDDVMEGDKFSVDKFKEVFNGDNGFFRKNQLESIVKGDGDLMHKLTGSRVGGIQSQLLRNVKSMGIEFDEEISKGSIEKQMDFAFKNYTKKTKAEIDELKSALEAKDVDAAVREYKTKYEKLNGTYNDTKSLLEKTAADLEAAKLDKLNFEKNFKIKGAHEAALGKIKFSKDVDDLKKEGFLSVLSKNYKIDTDENGNPVPLTQDGKRIAHPNKASSFMTVDELYEHEAVKNKLIANEQSSKFGSTIVTSQNPNKDNGNGVHKAERKLWNEH